MEHKGGPHARKVETMWKVTSMIRMQPESATDALKYMCEESSRRRKLAGDELEFLPSKELHERFRAPLDL
jgi:hypothetical protein